MTNARIDQLLTILQDHFDPREEGWLWLALFREDDGEGVVNEFTGEYADVEATGRALSLVINGLVERCEVERAYLALCRYDGRPREADRELWRILRHEVPADVLLDLVVFNRDSAWSMRAEDAAARDQAS